MIWQNQWRSQALKSGRWDRALMPGRNPGGGLGRRPQKPDIYREFVAVKWFFTQVCCRVPPPSPPLPRKKFFGSARILWPNMTGIGWVFMPTRGYATGKKQIQPAICANSEMCLSLSWNLGRWLCSRQQRILNCERINVTNGIYRWHLDGPGLDVWTVALRRRLCGDEAPSANLSVTLVDSTLSYITWV